MMLAPASMKQLRFIKALTWKLRPYYLHEQWQKIRFGLLAILHHPDVARCNRLIRRMLSTLAAKKDSTIYWIPMDYRLASPNCQKNLLRLAKSILPDEVDEWKDLETQDSKTWRILKNKIERQELIRSRLQIPDDQESDTRFSEWEEERWQKDKRPYSELVAGIDFLEPTPGID